MINRTYRTTQSGSPQTDYVSLIIFTTENRDMYIQKKFKLLNIIRFSGWQTFLLGLWTSCVFGMHVIFHDSWVKIPWLPISVVAIAVSFYIGFKNNQAYDRLWEARKIWGAIVNSSRAWGSVAKSYLTEHFAEGSVSEGQLTKFRTTLIYRHIAWLYALRSQLLIPTPWEHISQGKSGKRSTEKQMKRFGVGLIDDHDTEEIMKKLLPSDEYDRLINYKNTATQIIDQQSQALKELRSQGIIDDFRHMEMQNILYDFYVHQGKAERIKKFPLPRQYGNSSQIFTAIFLFLLPFGMLTEFHKLGEQAAWLSIPFSILVGWVFIMMELVGDYSENPFEGLGNDIPMLALCRTIEIDLREMLGEEDLPKSIEAVNGVLM